MLPAPDAVEVARQVRTRWRLTQPLQFDDLVTIVEELGVQVIADYSLVEAGVFDPTERSHGAIRLRGDDGPSRQKFTLAHEFGHTLVTNRKFSADEEEEKWCNKFAQSLLMPPDWVSSCYGHLPRTLSTLKSMSEDAEVSMAAALVALHETDRWKDGMLLNVRNANGRWRLWSSTYVPRRWLPGIKIPFSASLVLASSDHRPHHESLPLSVFGVETHFSAQLVGRGPTRWVLADRRDLANAVARANSNSY